MLGESRLVAVSSDTVLRPLFVKLTVTEIFTRPTNFSVGLFKQTS